VGQSEGKRTLARPRHRWVDDFKLGPKEIGYESMTWIPMTQGRGQ
jgi:hypothetical protein